MKNKEKSGRLVLPVVILVFYFGFVTFLNIIDPTPYDKYPKKSIRNEFMLYNSGCCFGLMDLSVLLTDNTGVEYLLFTHPAPPYGERIVAGFPHNISGSVQVTLSFQYEYITKGLVEFPIMDFETLDTLRKNGLLLIFGDGDLKVQSGKREAFFSYDQAPWAE